MIYLFLSSLFLSCVLYHCLMHKYWQHIYFDSVLKTFKISRAAKIRSTSTPWNRDIMSNILSPSIPYFLIFWIMTLRLFAVSLHSWQKLRRLIIVHRTSTLAPPTWFFFISLIFCLHFLLHSNNKHLFALSPCKYLSYAWALSCFLYFSQFSESSFVPCALSFHIHNSVPWSSWSCFLTWLHHHCYHHFLIWHFLLFAFSTGQTLSLLYLWQ